MKRFRFTGLPPSSIQRWITPIRNGPDIGGKVNDLAKLEDEYARGRAGTKIQHKRKEQIASIKKRIEELPGIYSFTYNPNGDNAGRDSLSHEEVIAMTSDFLTSKETLQKIILSKYPFILINESQDTLKPFMMALLEFENAYHGKLALGLFGDIIQRIYGHGLADLVSRVPERWDKPAKVMNHRSRARIIDLTNCIRADADKRKQQPRSDRAGGFVRLFIAPNEGTDRGQFEDDARTVTWAPSSLQLIGESFGCIDGPMRPVFPS